MQEVQTMKVREVGTSSLHRKVGGVSNQKPLPKAGVYVPWWADHI